MQRTTDIVAQAGTNSNTVSPFDGHEGDVNFYPPRHIAEAQGDGVEGTIYLIHFDEPISDGHTTQHYVGFTTDLEARIELHRKGRGARLTQVATQRGIAFSVVATFPGTRADERRLKNRHETPNLCPICKALRRERKNAARRARRAARREAAAN